MSQKFQDPILTAAERERYQQYVDNLFEPIRPEGLTLPMPYLVEGLIPRGYLCVLASGPKEGKTCLATALALAVATGTPFAGMPTEQSTVLWLACEESHRERWQILKLSPLADPATPLFTCHQHLPIDTEEGINLILEWVGKTQSKLVVVDPLHAATSGRSLQDGWNARRSLQMLKENLSNSGITALVLHHAKDLNRRTGFARVAESDQLAATASMNIVLSKQDCQTPSPFRGRAGVGVVNRKERKTAATNGQSETPNSKLENPNYRLVHLHCTGRGEFANRNLTLISHGPLDYQVVSEDLATKPKPPFKTDDLERRLIAYIGKSRRTSTQMLQALGWDYRRLQNVLTRLRAKGVVALVKSDKWPRRYRLCMSPEQIVKANSESN